MWKVLSLWFKGNSTQCTSGISPWPNLIFIMYKWSSNSYTRDKDGPACWWYKYPNKGYKWKHSKSKRKQSYAV